MQHIGLPLSACTVCGAVLESGTFAQDVQFVKGATGDAAVVGQYVTGDGTRTQRAGSGRLFGTQDSHERTAEKGRQEIEFLANHVQLPPPREALIEQAFRLYKLALQHSFTKGRRVDQVAAACLYTICRIEGKPFMLIDFSDALQINVFTLGNVFSQLMQLLRMQEHPVINKPVDPSLYLDRFAKKLGFKDQASQVVETALHLVASMKRDWMQTGRRPSGICGAALYLAAHIHGFERSKRQVIAVVHIGEQTLHKRVMEFANTTSADLLADDFEETAKDLALQQEEAIQAMQPEDSAPDDAAVCDHLRNKAAPHFVHGLCLACYKEAVQLSGGYNVDHPLLQGRDPPASSKLKWQEAQRIAKRQKELALAAPEEQARIEEEFEATMHDTSLMQLAQFVSHAVDSDGDETPSQPAHTPAASSHAGPQDSAAAPSEVSRGETEAPYSWQAVEGVVRVWAQRWLDFDEQGVESNSALFDSLSRFCRQHGMAPPPALTKSSREIRFATFLVGLLPRLPGGVTDGTMVRCFHKGVRSITGIKLREEPLLLDASMSDISTHALVPLDAALRGSAHEDDDVCSEAPEEPLSDLEDEEIDAFIHTEEESKIKELVWNTMHSDYIKEQAEKQARRAQQEENDAMREAAGGKPKRRRSMRRDLSGETAAEAVGNMLQSKKLSKKINYDKVNALFQSAERELAQGQAHERTQPGASATGSALEPEAPEPSAASGLVVPPPPTVKRSRPRAMQRVPGRGRGRGRGRGTASASTV